MSPERRHPKKVIVIMVIAVVVLAAVLLGAAWLLGWFNPPPTYININVGTPGAASGEASDLRLDAESAAAMSLRVNKLLMTNNGMLASSYSMAGPFDEPPAALSVICLASDQLLYGQYLIEQGRRVEFSTWWQDYTAAFVTIDGLVRVQSGLSNDKVTTVGDFWRVNLSTLRLLAQSCTLWPDIARQESMRRLSDRLLTLGSQSFSTDYTATVPTPKPTPDFEATPTPKPTQTPAATETGDSLSVLRLASLDLYTLQQMAAFDSRWQALFDRSLPVVQSGYISDDLPLYALGYVEDGAASGYLYFDGDSPSVNTEESLLTLLHLCEVGQENPRSISWLRDQMFNQNALYESYHIVQGQATSSQECLPGYAIVARIARIEGDSDLYSAAVNRLLWHQATSQTSEVLSTIFREDSQKLVNVRASDNGWALLALR